LAGICYEDDDGRRTCRIPLTERFPCVWNGATDRAQTENLNRDGTLILSPMTCRTWTVIEVTSSHDRDAAQCRAVWAGSWETGGSGRVELGVHASSATQRGGRS
jgi:hypothetical protein